MMKKRRVAGNKAAKRPALSPDRIIAAMIEAGGVVDEAAKILKATSRDVAVYLVTHPDIHDKLEAAHSRLVDEALRSASDLVANRDQRMTQFVLTKMAGSRGIQPANRIQIGGDGKNPVDVRMKEIDLSNIGDEELERMYRLLKEDKE